MAARSQERMRQMARQQEYTREDQVRKLNQDTVLAANLQSDGRVDMKRRMRIISQQQQEVEYLRQLEEETAARRAREMEQQQQAQIAREMDRLKLEQTRDEKFRQQVRNTSVELRDLQSKLNAAYMSKELQAQRSEKMLQTQTTKQNDMVTARQMEEARLAAEAAAQEKEKQQWLALQQYHRDLDVQLQDQELRKQQAYEEFLKEKMKIDEIVQQIMEEDRRKQEEIATGKLRNKQELENYRKMQEEIRRREMALVELENANVLRQAREMEQKDAEYKAARAAANEGKEKVQSYLADKIMQERQDREELERLRQELHEEEAIAHQREKDTKEFEDRIRKRMEMQRFREEDITHKRAREERERQEDEQFRQAMLEKFALDDRLEQMNAQKRRQKQADHRKAVESLLEERRQRKLFEQQQKQQEILDQEQYEAVKKQIIEEERARILQEHASKLLGYLPKGVIRDHKDLEVLDPELRAAFLPQQQQYGDDASLDDYDFGTSRRA